MDQLPLSKLVQAGQKGGEGVWLVVVMAGTNHARLNRFEDIEEDGLALQALDARHRHLQRLLLCGARGAGPLPLLLQLQIAQLLQLAG